LHLIAPNAKPDDRYRCGITVRLGIAHTNQTGTIAISNALQDIQRSGLPHAARIADSEPMQVIDAAVNTDPQQSHVLMALGNVVWKLDLLVKIVDKTAKVTFSLDI